jgi:hypothetical protein
MAGRGSVILVVGVALILMHIIASLIELGARATENMAWYNAATVSKNLASIGANAGLAHLRENPDQHEKGYLFEQTMATGPYKGGKFRVFSHGMGNDIVRLLVASELPVTGFDTLRDTVIVLMQTKGSNEYRMFSWVANINGNAQFFYPDDITWGPVHSNGGIHLGNVPQNRNVPVFHGKVTAVQTINPVGGNRAKFLGGYQVGTNELTVPANINDLKNAAQGIFGKSYTQDVYIEIDGKDIKVWYSSAEVTDPGVAPNEQYALHDFNGAIYTTENVSVKGVLDGKVTIGAGKDIHIVDNITYTTQPAYADSLISIVDGMNRHTQIPHGDDLLGLYAENNIIIADKDQDFDVHGVLLALGELRAENYDSRTLNELNVWGSVIMNDRGCVRSQNNGLKQRYRYDTRLEDASFRPLFYPGMTKNAFEILSWYESIQLPPI